MAPDERTALEQLLAQQQEEIKTIKGQLARIMGSAAQDSLDLSGTAASSPRLPSQCSPIPYTPGRGQGSPRRAAMERIGNAPPTPGWTRPMASTYTCQQLNVKGPLPMESSSLVRLNKWMALYGGTNGAQLMGDVWLYDPLYENWRKAQCWGEAPLARYAHTAVVYKKSMVVFGGFGLGGVAAGQPHGRDQPSLDASSTMVGYSRQWRDTDQGYRPITCGLLSDIHILDPTSLMWQRVQHRTDSVQNHMKNHSAVVHGHHMYVFGGCMLQGRSNVVKVYDLEKYQWLPDKPFNPQLVAYAVGLSGAASLVDLPCARSGHTAVVAKDPNHQPCMVVFGGRASKSVYCADIFMYNFETRMWHKLQTTGAAPSARAGHSAVMYKNQMVVFGGYAFQNQEKVYFNSIHVLDMGSLTWRKVAINAHVMPQPRCGHVAAVYEALDKSIKMLTFGGWGEVSPPDANPDDWQALAKAMYAPNSDTFLVGIANPVQTQPSGLPKLHRSARHTESLSSTQRSAGRLNEAGEEEQAHEAPQASPFCSPRSTKRSLVPRPFSVSTSPRVQVPAPPPHKPLPTKLSKRVIAKVVERLADQESVLKARQQLEEKYTAATKTRFMSGPELEESVDRLYYQERVKQKERMEGLSQKYMPAENGKVLEEEQMLELVERLTAPLALKELPYEKPKYLSKEAEEAVVSRLYTEEISTRETKMKALFEKYNMG